MAKPEDHNHPRQVPLEEINANWSPERHRERFILNAEIADAIAPIVDGVEGVLASSIRDLIKPHRTK